MYDLVRALVYQKEVSLTIADTTRLVRKGIEIHKLSEGASYPFGRGMSALTYMSGCLKEEVGEISISLQCDGEIGSFAGSGNRALQLRGYVGNPQTQGKNEREALGENGSLTVVRDDGYNRPFVGACAFPEGGDFDGVIEEYYRVSEQLPTRVKTAVELQNGECVFAGIIVLQPLPFASQESLRKLAELDLAALLAEVKRSSIAKVVEERFDAEELQTRAATYECTCSRERLAAVLATLGREQFEEILREDGRVRAHCHYCNSDYEFTEKDIDEIFRK